MSEFQLILNDPFVNYREVSKFIASELNLKYIPIGHLFFSQNSTPESVRKINNGQFNYYSAFQLVVLNQLNDEKCLIPDYPRFLEHKAEVISLVERLKKEDYTLNRIWYLKNDDLRNCIGESLKMKGYKEPITKFIANPLQNALNNQKRKREIIKEIQNDFKIVEISTKTMIGISEKTKNEIKTAN